MLHQQIPQDFLKTIASDRGLSDAELEALSMALDGKTTGAIATELEISPVAVRKRLGEVYRKLDITGKTAGKLTELKHKLLSQYQKRQAVQSSEIIVAPTEPKIPNVYPDWDGAPDVSIGFYGRGEELQTLKKWIVEDHCKLIAISGIVGIGKSSLATKLAEEIQDHFEYVIWRSLHHISNFDHLLDNLLQILPQPQKPNFSKENSKLSQLMECLKTHHCLLVLDGVEKILVPQDPHRRYLEEHQEYGTLLQRMGQERQEHHKSCLILTTRERPFEIACLAGETLPVREIKLTGLQLKDAAEILQSKGLSTNLTLEEIIHRYKEIIEHYNGNPLWLKIVSTTIKNVFDGHITAFSKSTKTISIPIMLADAINWQYERLSDLEKKIINFIATEGEDKQISRQDMQKISGLEKSDVLNSVLESLEGRSLIEKRKPENKDTGTTLFTLHDVVSKCVRERLEKEDLKIA